MNANSYDYWVLNGRAFLASGSENGLPNVDMRYITVNMTRSGPCRCTLLEDDQGVERYEVNRTWSGSPEKSLPWPVTCRRQQRRHRW